MWYHAIGEFGGEKPRYWWNRTREDLVSDVVLPLLGKEVRILRRRDKKAIFNFGAISYLTVVKTEAKLETQAAGTHPLELEDHDFTDNNNATLEFMDALKVDRASRDSRSILQQSTTEPLKQIFVVMKFGDRTLDSAYAGVIKPLAKEFGYRVLRVDEIRDSGQIASQVLENISKSEIVLADLSGERPNCYYEAGFAHALGKELIFCVRDTDTVHFDLAGYRFIKWGTEAELRGLLRDRLESYKSKGTE